MLFKDGLKKAGGGGFKITISMEALLNKQLISISFFVTLIAAQFEALHAAHFRLHCRTLGTSLCFPFICVCITKLTSCRILKVWRQVRINYQKHLESASESILFRVFFSILGVMYHPR